VIDQRAHGTTISAGANEEIVRELRHHTARDV